MLLPKKFRYMQYFACLSGTLSVTMISLFTVWPSPSLPKLMSDDSPIGRPVTVEEGSWIVALLTLAPVFLTYQGNWVLEKYGRKFSLLFSALPALISWIMTIYGESIVVLYIARFIAGICTSFVNAAVSMYVGEVADKDIRGQLGTAFSLMKLLGYVIVFSVGPYASYEGLGWVCFSLPVIFFLVFVKMPESPYFLVKIGKKEQALKNLTVLSPKNTTKEALEKKMMDIEDIVSNDMQNKASWSALFKRENRIALWIMLGIKTLQQFSGALAIDSYMQTIIASSNSGINMELSSILYGIIQIPAVLLAAALVDKIGRKPILIISAIGCAISLFAEGAFFYLQDYLQDDVSSLSWLPLAALIMFAVMNNFGLCTIPYIFMGELFATNVKELACTLSITYSVALAFLVSKFFEPISVALGRYTMFWIFGFSCVIGCFFIYFCVPETKSKTFDEIQNKINKKVNKEPKKQPSKTEVV